MRMMGMQRVVCNIVAHQAVATGDHLACSAPVPRTQWASSTISCPGRILASRMSSCTSRAPAGPSSASWLLAYRQLVSSGISLPLGSHLSCPDFTAAHSALRQSWLHD